MTQSLLSLRSFVIQVLAVMRLLTQKMVGVRARLNESKVSYLLRKSRETAEIADPDYKKLLAAVEATPAKVAVGTACYEALMSLEVGELPPEYRDEIEMEILEVSRIYRAAFIRAALLSLQDPPRDGYPRSGDVEPARRQARARFTHIAKATAGERSALVKVSSRLRTWACAEAAAEASVQAASRDLEEAEAWARLGVEIADLVSGPEGWTNRLKGFAAAHLANILKAAGRLKAADATLGPARKLWLAGSDPDQILDPGRLLDLEAALRREQRRFDEALSLLEEARVVSRCPARTLISKGFTLEVMGEYQRAVEALLEAEPLLDRHTDPRTWYKQRLNLAVNFCHVCKYRDAEDLVAQASPVVFDLKDEIEGLRLVWLNGRISAGLGRSAEARQLLEQASQGFAARNMWYDVALAAMESGALLLDEGRAAEVKALIPGLVKEFQSRDVHREALAALRLFQEATELETATAEMARSVLRFLFLARHNQGLRFSS
jgi:tetratricopeptide (TPR) repeat protein